MPHSRLAISIAIALLLAACTSSGGDESAGPTLEADAAVDATAPAEPAPADVEPTEATAGCDADLDRATLVRERSVPGGRQLHLALFDADGAPLDGSLGSCLTISDERLGELRSAFGVQPAGDGATLIVAQRDDSEATRAFIDTFVETRPAGERIAVWSWADEVVQAVGATTDRERLQRRLDATWSSTSAVVLEPAEAADIAAEEWEQLAEGALLGVRRIVFVAPSLELDELPDIDRDVITDYWVTSPISGETNNRVLGVADMVEAATELSGRLDRSGDATLTVVGFCDDGEDLDLTITGGDDVERSFGIGDAADEFKGIDCTPEEARDISPSDRLVLAATLDDDERAVYQSALVQLGERAELPFAERLDRDDDIEWTATMSIGDSPGEAGYEGKFRGQSTLGCERRSRSIDFDGGDARHLLADSGTDEFTLISMCADPGYVRQIIGQSIMEANGLWFLEGDTVEFRLDGASQGVYLLNERLPDELRNDRSRLTSIIRRHYDVADQPDEVDFAGDSTDEEALSRYDSILIDIDGLVGQVLVDTLESRLDLDQYLRWVALNTALQNGDYIDEVYFAGEETLRADGSVGEYFTIHAWDPDGLFLPCHRDGRLAIEDPNGLLYCTESLLDRAIFADLVVYDRYVAILASVLDELDAEQMSAIAEEATASITRWLDDEAIVAAMNEFEQDYERFGGDLRGLVDGVATDLVNTYDARRTELLGAIAAYEPG